MKAESDSNIRAQPQSSPGEPNTAESKRQDARRRFLKGAAAGSGAVIVTFYHQRANAKKIMTSSAAVCTSMHGTPGKTHQVKDVTKPPTASKVTAVECKIK